MAKQTLRRSHKSRGLQRKSRGLQRKSRGLQRKSRRLGHKRKSRIQRGGNKEQRFDSYYGEILNCLNEENWGSGFCKTPSILFDGRPTFVHLLDERSKDPVSLKDLICNNDLKTVIAHEQKYFISVSNPRSPNDNGWHRIITALHRFVHNDPDDKPDPKKLLGHVYNLLFPPAGRKQIPETGATGATGAAAAARPGTAAAATTGATTGAAARPGAATGAATTTVDTRPYAPEGWVFQGNVWNGPNGAFAPADTYKARPKGAEVAAADQLPEGWRALTDPASGKTYYANITTSQTQWERPVSASAAAASATGSIATSVDQLTRLNAALDELRQSKLKEWSVKYDDKGNVVFYNTHNPNITYGTILEVKLAALKDD